MERYVATHLGTFCFVRLIYSDATWHRVALDYGVLKPDGLVVGRFSN